MSGATTRTVVFVISIITIGAACLFDLNKIWDIYGLMGFGWLFFTGLANDIVERISGITKKSESILSENSKWDLVSFNDAVANEIMKIRTELVGIKIKQDNLGWHKISNDFLKMFWMYNTYPSSFICTYLEKPEDYAGDDEYQGKIIIVLDNDINLDAFWEVAFDANKLIKLNSVSSNAIKSGMNISVFICEENDAFYSTSERSAKVLSIEEDRHSEDIYVTLEINLDTIFHHLQWRPEKDIGKNKIIRKFHLSTWESAKHHCAFVVDKVEERHKESILTSK